MGTFINILCSIILTFVSAGLLYCAFLAENNYDSTTKNLVLVISIAIGYAIVNLWI